MRCVLTVAVATVAVLLCAATPAPQSSAPAAAGALRINAQGTFTDAAGWIYKTPAGTYGYTAPTVGTNETLDVPAPTLTPGSVVSAVIIKRHSFDTLGYPLHIALVEKLFGSMKSLIVFVSGSAGELREYDAGQPAAKETMKAGKSAPGFSYTGPIPADGPIPSAMQPAFSFAKGAMDSIVNLPDAQKNLKNYVVLFVVEGGTTWVEFGPVFAPGESPHLGCQTQAGRDMVFGYDATQPQSNGSSGKWLQCF